MGLAPNSGIVDAAGNPLSPATSVRWITRPGDATNDGVFDSSDLIAVFTAGKYEDDIPGNASFEDGDWNGDGDFDSGDLVDAAQHANADVAASVDHVFAQRASAVPDDQPDELAVELAVASSRSKRAASATPWRA